MFKLLNAEDVGRELVRVGVVTSTDPVNATCRVTFEDKNNLVSGDLRILHRGSVSTKDYWMPAINDEVVCIFPTNDENYCDGFIVGTLFNDKDKPNANKQEITRIDFSDGTFIEHNAKSRTLKIECAGNIYIKGKRIYLNE